MLILGIEASAQAASVALCRDGELLAQSYQRSGLTHSRTLLPMAEALLKNTETDKSALDVIAVARGPGSFTGIRIGVSTAKGLCWGLDIPAIGVSTLEAMAELIPDFGQNSLICPCMDARRAQVYNALFERRDGKLIRLTEDRAIAAADVAEELKTMDRPVILLGDGWAVGEKALSEHGVPYSVAPEYLRYQNAWGVCLASADKAPDPAQELLPVYLRLSQAERERQERMS